MQFDPWDLLGKLWVIVAGILAFIFKRHLDEDGEIAKRVGALEATCATRADVTRVETSLTGLRQQVASNHAEILQTLLDRR